MRKLALTGVAVLFTLGLAAAADVTFLGYDKEKKELKVKEGEKEMTVKVTEKTKFMQGDKDYDSVKGIARLEKMEGNEKQKGKSKFKVTVEKDEATEIGFPAPKPKN